MMALKLAAFLITMVISIAAGAVILFFMLIAMNGYNGDDAMWGLGTYVLLALAVAILSSTGAFLLVGFLSKKQFGPVACALIAMAVFSIINIGLEIVCSLIGILVADFVRVKF